MNETTKQIMIQHAIRLREALETLHGEYSILRDAASLCDTYHTLPMPEWEIDNIRSVMFVLECEIKKFDEIIDAEQSERPINLRLAFLRNTPGYDENANKIPGWPPK